MYSIVLEEMVVAEQYRGPVFVDVQQAASQSGGSGGAVTGITSGTITVTDPGDGSRNIELPQALGTGAVPTFSGLTIANLAAVGDLSVGGAETIRLIDYGTIAADPGSIAAQSRGSVDVTITGVAVGDIVLMNPPNDLNAGLVFGGCRVVGVNTVRIYLANLTGGAIDDGPNTYDYLWIDLT